PLLLDRRPGPRPLRLGALRRPPLHHLQPVERRLPAKPPRDGRQAPGRDRPAARTALAPAGPELCAPYDPSAELPRAATRAPQLPPGGAAPATGLAEKRPGHRVPRRRNLLQLPCGILDRHLLDQIAVEGCHQPPPLLLDEVGGL